MADVSGWSLLRMLEEVWRLIVAFFVWRPTSGPELPVSVPRRSVRSSTKNTCGPRGLSRKASTIETWHAEKEHFLRHPSLRSKQAGQGSSTDEARAEKRRRRIRPSIIIPPEITFERQESITMEIQPPSRPESETLPAVIITPSTPTGDVHPPGITEFPFPSSPTSPLDFVAATNEQRRLSTKASEAIFVDTAKVHSVTIRHSTVPLDAGRDVSEIGFPVPIITESPPSPHSLVLPQSLQNLTFEPICYAGSALSALSGMLWDAPSWSSASTAAATKHLGVEAPPFFTSTPPKRRGGGTAGVENLKNNLLSAETASSPPIQAAISEPLDAQPYPDVFDLDMYYDTRSSIRASLKTPSRSLSRVDSTSPEMENDSSFNLTYMLSPDTSVTEARSSKRFGMLPGCSGTGIGITGVFDVAPVDHEVKRYRDHYRHAAYSRPSPPLGSVPVVVLQDSPLVERQKHRSVINHPVVPLRDITNTYPKCAAPHTHITRVKSLTSVKQQRHQQQQRNPILLPDAPPLLTPASAPSPISRTIPTVVVPEYTYDSPSSTYSQSSRFNDALRDSETESEGSMCALKARLRETRDNFAKPVWNSSDESSGSWEPVPF